MKRQVVLLHLLLLLAGAGAEAAEVRGTVFDAAGQPLAGATVALTPPGGEPVAATTDARGRYTFTGLRAGRHTLVVYKAGFSARRQDVNLNSAAQVVGTHFRLSVSEDVPGSITGMVFREGGRIPLAGATVALARETMPGQGHEEAGETISGETGFFAFADLRPGRYLLSVRADGYQGAPQRALVVTEGGAGQSVEVTLRRPHPKSAPGIVSATVTRADGQPAANTEVGVALQGQYVATQEPWGNEIERRGGDSGADDAGRMWDKIAGVVKTDAAGGCRVTLPAGEWSLSVRLTGHVAQTREVVVAAGKPADPLAFRLVAGKGEETPAPAQVAPPARVEVTLRGAVFKPDGAPLAGTGVYVFVGVRGRQEHLWVDDWHGLPETYVVTSADGRFERRLLWPEEQRTALVAAKSRGFAECEGVPVELPKGGTAEVTLKLPGPALSVAGRVTGEDGKPRAGAVVYAYRVLGRWDDDNWRRAIANPWYTAEANDAGPLPFDTPVGNLNSGVVAGLLRHGLSYGESGADGRFTLAELDGGTYHFGATLPGYDVATREHVSVNPGAAPEVALILRRLGSIEGTVTGPHGAPLATTTVRITRQDTGAADASVTTVERTDAGGRYHLDDLRAGTYRLRLIVPGHAPAVREGVVVKSGRPTDGADIRLQAGLTVRGKALLADGTPAAGAMVRLTQDVGGEAVNWEALAGADGTFTITGPAAGVGKVSLRLPNQPISRATVALPQAPGLLLEVRFARLVTVRGTLRDTAGKPVAGARVSSGRAGTSVAPDDQFWVQDMTNDAGEFRLSGQPPGPVNIGAHKQGYRPMQQAHVLPEDGREVSLDLKTEELRYGSARGRVLRASGAPAEQAVLYIRVEGSGAPGGRATTDARGEFRMEKVPAGKANLYLSMREKRGPVATAPIEEGRETLFADVTLDPAGSLECMVRGRERLPAGAHLLVLPYPEPADADGKRLPAGASVRLFLPTPPPTEELSRFLPGDGDLFYASEPGLGVSAYPPGTRALFTPLRMLGVVKSSEHTTTLPFVPPGPCTVGPGCILSDTFGATLMVFQPGVPAEVPVDKTTRVELDILAGGLLSVRLAGGPESRRGAVVGIVHRGTWRMAGQAMLQGGAAFTMPNLAPGDYLAVFWPVGMAGVLVSFTIRAGETTEIPLAATKGVALRGRVKGSLPRNTCVSAESAAGFDGAKVADDGTFTLEHLLPGTYTLRAFAPAEGKIVSLPGVKVGDAGGHGVEMEWK